MTEEEKHKKSKIGTIEEMKVGSKRVVHSPSSDRITSPGRGMQTDKVVIWSCSCKQSTTAPTGRPRSSAESVKRLHRWKCLDLGPRVRLATIAMRRPQEVQSTRNAEYEAMQTRCLPVIGINREIQIHYLSLQLHAPNSVWSGALWRL